MSTVHKVWLSVKLQGGTPLSMETPTKSSGNTDQGLMKKLKEFDGLAMSIGNGNGNAESAERGVENGLSHRFVDPTFILYVYTCTLELMNCSFSIFEGWGRRSRGKKSDLSSCHVNVLSWYVLVSK